MERRAAGVPRDIRPAGYRLGALAMRTIALTAMLLLFGVVAIFGTAAFVVEAIR